MRYKATHPPREITGLLRYLNEEFFRVERGLDLNEFEIGRSQWEDLRFPANGINVPGPAGAPTWNTTYVGLEFVGNGTRDVQGVAQLPHAWDVGTEIHPHIHFMVAPGSAVAASVWVLSYNWLNLGDAWASLTAVTMTVSHSASSTLVSTLSSWPAIQGTGKQVSSILHWQLSRLGATDAFNGSVILAEFDIHYQANSLGSLGEYQKR